MTTGVFLLVLASAGTHAGWNFLARRVSGDMAVLWLALWTGCLLFLPVVVGLVVLHGAASLARMLSEGYGYVLATGVVHAGYFLFLSRAYEHGDISTVYPIARGSGVGCTALLAWLILHEPISATGLAGLLLITLGILSTGVAVYFRRGHGSSGFLHALSVGATIVAYSLIDKVGVGIVHPVLYIWLMFLTSALLLWPYILRAHRDTVLRTGWGRRRSVLLIGGGMIGTYAMVLFAFTMGPVSYVVAVREFAVVIGAFLGVLFLKERLTPGRIATIIAVTAGIICIKIG